MASTLLLLLGAIIFLGFLGNAVFQRTRIPDVLLLILMGILMGPVLSIIPPDAVRAFMPFFGTIALTMILFEGGLDLDLGHALRQGGRAILLAVVSFAGSMLVVYYAITLAFGVAGRTPLAVAAALACTSAPIVIPVMARLAPASPMRPLLAIESALSDALAVMIVLALAGSHGDTTLSAFGMAGRLANSISLGTGAGILAGVLWLSLLGTLARQRFNYLMTLAFLFLLIGAVESFHGSGAVAVLVFGMILANGEALVRLFGREAGERLLNRLGPDRLVLHPEITESHAQASFLVRAFFFVYLGIIFRWPGSDADMWLSVVLVSLGVIVAREVAVLLVAWATGIPAVHRRLLLAMLPRGLATAVLASLLISHGEEGPAWETLAAFVILVTNAWMALRIPGERRPAAKPSAGAAAAIAALLLLGAAAPALATTPSALLFDDSEPAPPPVARDSVLFDSTLVMVVVGTDSARTRAEADSLGETLRLLRSERVSAARLRIDERDGAGVLLRDTTEVLRILPENRVDAARSPLAHALAIREIVLRGSGGGASYREEELLLRLLLGAVYPFSLLVLLRLVRTGVRRWEQRWRAAALGTLSRWGSRRGFERAETQRLRIVDFALGLERFVVFTAVVAIASFAWFSLFPQTQTLATQFLAYALGPALGVIAGAGRGVVLLLYSVGIVMAARWTSRRIREARDQRPGQGVLRDPLVYLPLQAATWLVATFLILFPYPGAPRFFALGMLLLVLLAALVSARPVAEEIGAGLFFNSRYPLRPGDPLVVDGAPYVVRDSGLLHLMADREDRLVRIPYTRLLRAELGLPPRGAGSA